VIGERSWEQYRNLGGRSKKVRVGK